MDRKANAFVGVVIAICAALAVTVGVGVARAYTHAPAHYWEGPNLFPTPIPPPNPPNVWQQCAGQIPFVTCLPGL